MMFINMVHIIWKMSHLPYKMAKVQGRGITKAAQSMDIGRLTQIDTL